MNHVTEPAFTSAQLTQAYREQQRSIDELERKLNVMTTLLDDLKRADDEHNAQTLLIKDPNWQLDEESDHFATIKRLCWCCFCCQ